jgi:light-harvesting complex I chlorophyll a/b binding protein 4
MLALFSHQQYAMVASTPKLTPGGPEVAKTMAGVTGPFGFFDPLGLTPETNEELRLFREAELAHSRVAMVGALGFLVQEKFHPIFPEFGGPSIRQLDQVLTTENGELLGSCLLLAVWFSEFARARIGWVEPEEEMRTLRENYAPGDLGFDPLNLKPKEPAALLAMQNKELNNGRLAMIACAGIVVQELVTGESIF